MKIIRIQGKKYLKIRWIQSYLEFLTLLFNNLPLDTGFST